MPKDSVKTLRGYVLDDQLRSREVARTYDIRDDFRPDSLTPEQRQRRRDAGEREPGGKDIELTDPNRKNYRYRGRKAGRSSRR